MDPRGQRPPRSTRPPGGQPPQPPVQSPPPQYPAYSAYPAAYPDHPATTYRPPYGPAPGAPDFHNQRGVSFQNREAGDRHEPLDQNRQRLYSAYQSTSPTPMDVEGGGFADGRVGRKKSLVRPEREKIGPEHRQYHYRNHAAELGDAIPSSASPYASFLPLSFAHVALASQPPATPRRGASCAAESRSSHGRRTSTSRGWRCSSVGRSARRSPPRRPPPPPTPRSLEDGSTISALVPRTHGTSTATLRRAGCPRSC